MVPDEGPLKKKFNTPKVESQGWYESPYYL